MLGYKKTTLTPVYLYQHQIQVCKPFTEPLATPAELPETFTSKMVKAEVIGITKCSKYYTCLKCKKKI
jgi:hypothetical protein